MTKDRIQLINATKQDALYLAVEKDCVAELKTFDTMGHVVREESVVLHKGIEALPVPKSGLLDIHIRN